MPEDRSHTVSALLAAYDTRVPIDPLSEHDPEFTVEKAYELQLQQVSAWTAMGRVIKGHKVGLTSSAMQRQLGVDQPDYGHLFADMFHLESVPIDTRSFISPKAEPEIAFVLDRDLSGPGVTTVDALRAVGYVLPALEIIDSRIRDWRITLPDTIADNASSGGVVLGSTPVALRGRDLRLTGCVLSTNGEVAYTGAGAAVLGSPINALVWLANTLGALGVTLEAGSVVLPGSLTAALPVTAGTTVTACFTGIGSVTACFAQVGEARQ
ncbi:2-keto-4-pentenoate hydratase [Mycolicibacterium wolinskyi]|uniref:2-keto-4-pentenoate hydratase n=1 Tax=Mycolicibacterium wolinskyi TaxID=59750 RepID=A0A132PUH4_9MYCO|nr:fumarylacetoacetate hydrolase family protein [Mycolicibacterium wolinskyi]KWX25998.1 2-keto-4-pentenoate hydratase [Mycolicibacterium wolinskyi]